MTRALIICQIKPWKITWKLKGFLADDTYELIEEAKYYKDVNVDGD